MTCLVSCSWGCVMTGDDVMDRVSCIKELVRDGCSEQALRELRELYKLLQDQQDGMFPLHWGGVRCRS